MLAKVPVLRSSSRGDDHGPRAHACGCAMPGPRMAARELRPTRMDLKGSDEYEAVVSFAFRVPYHAHGWVCVHRPLAAGMNWQRVERKACGWY